MRNYDGAFACLRVAGGKKGGAWSVCVRSIFLMHLALWTCNFVWIFFYAPYINLYSFIQLSSVQFLKHQYTIRPKYLKLKMCLLVHQKQRISHRFGGGGSGINVLLYKWILTLIFFSFKFQSHCRKAETDGGEWAGRRRSGRGESDGPWSGGRVGGWGQRVHTCSKNHRYRTLQVTFVCVSVSTVMCN